ncbi:hypothetical protein PLESTM_000024500 [Pleodorina starrii]|nr:hypothetical protein PLESTM_000024500 [Pleodorina starrii]
MEHLAAAAVVAAWPGSTILARIRRRIALELASVRDGPFGPYSSLGARLSSSLRAKSPRLVAEASGLCQPPDGTLRFGQLLAHGPGFHAAHPSPEDVSGGTFLYCSRHDSDICIVLDLAALLKWHSDSPVGPRTPSDTDGGARRYGDDADAARRAAGPPPPLLPRVTSYDVVAGGSGAGAAGGGDAAFEAVAGDAALSIEELGLRAYPGPSVASELRRVLVQRLSAAGPDGDEGLPPYTVPYRQLAQLVAASKAAAAHRQLMSATAFRTFLEHPASAGAFRATRITLNPNNNGANNGANKPTANSGAAAAAAAAAATAGYVDCVQLVVPALRRAAAAGLAVAIAAAWPGGAPLQRLKRAAARVLATAHTAAGLHSMGSGPMGNELIKREALAYSAVRSGTGAGGRLMLKLDESAEGGHLLYVRFTGEGCLRLRLDALLREFPREETQELGLPRAAVGSSSGAAAMTHGSVHPTSRPPPSAAPAPHYTTGTGAQGFSSGGRPLGLDPVSLLGFSQPPPVAAPESPPPSAEVSAGAVGMKPVPVPVPVPVAFQSAQPYGTEEAIATAASEHPMAANGDPPGGNDHHGNSGSLWVPGEAVNSAPLLQPQLQPQSQWQQQEQLSQEQAQQQQQSHYQQQAPSALVEPVVHWVRMTPEFESLVQHCCAAGQVGLAVHCSGGGAGRAEMAAVYAPAAAAASVDQYGAATPGWPAVTYLIDCTALSVGSQVEKNDDGDVAAAAAAAATTMLRDILENPGVVKVVHGCAQQPGWPRDGAGGGGEAPAGAVGGAHERGRPVGRYGGGSDRSGVGPGDRKALSAGSCRKRPLGLRRSPDPQGTGAQKAAGVSYYTLDSMR